MKTILYNPIFINPQAYYVFPRLTRYLQPDNESTAEPANYIGTIEVKVIAYGDTTLERTYANTDSIDLSEFKNTWIRISLFTKVGSCVLGEWKIGNMESDLPYIDPEVLASLKAVVIVGNKTNNDSDRAIVKNLVDPDNPFVISNAAYKLNSGFGKYEEDFTAAIWTKNSKVTFTDSRLSTNKDFSSPWIAYKRANQSEIHQMTVKVSGIPNGGILRYLYIEEGNNKQTSFDITKDGIYKLPASYISEDTNNAAGFHIPYTNYDWTNIVIEQIPSFEGAFVTDGVNDLITSTKTVQEMLGGSDEITVLSMIEYLGSTYDARINFAGRAFGNTYLNNRIKLSSGKGKSYILGYTKSRNDSITNIEPLLGDKSDCSSAIGEASTINATFSVAGYVRENNTAEYNSIAWYWTFIANKILTEDEINQVIAYYNLDRTLKPDILCDVKKQGITNENHAEFGDKLIDYSGNNRDIQLNNIAWNKESGIDDNGALHLDGVNDFGKVTGMPIYKDFTVIANRRFIGAHTGAVISKSYTGDSGAFYFESGSSVASFGLVTRLAVKEDIDISYLSKYVYKGDDIQSGTAVDSDKMWLGILRDNDPRFSNIAIYSLMSFPYSMSEFLIERQLKKHKLGTLYPDMVEFRPIVKSNSEYQVVDCYINTFPAVVGKYYPINSKLRIAVTTKGAADEVTSLTVNGVSLGTPSVNGNRFTFNGTLSDKSPQKINITIDKYTGDFNGDFNKTL